MGGGGGTVSEGGGRRGWGGQAKRMGDRDGGLGEGGLWD